MDQIVITIGNNFEKKNWKKLKIRPEYAHFFS